MHVLIWVVSGLVTGWLTRVAMRRRDHGVAADLTVGLIGGLVGGNVARWLGIAIPATVPAHVAIGVFGAMTLVGVTRIFGHLAAQAGMGERSERMRAAVHDLEAQIGRLGELDRHVLSKLLRREPVARDAADAFAEQLSFGDRLADKVASFGGSWTFIWLFLAGMFAWMSANMESAAPFDPYPFILLNLILSCVAALQAPVIMMSQNRQAAKDRLEAHHDYEVNLKAELEILALHTKLDELREQHLRDLLRLQEEQLGLLRTIRSATVHG